MRRTGALTLALVVGCGLISGCSDHGSGAGGATSTTFESYEPPEGITLEDWQGQTTAVCAVYEPQQDAVLAARGQANSLEEVVAFLDELLPIGNQYVAELNAVPVPAARRSDVERTYALNESNVAAAVRLRDAAAGGDRGSFQAAEAALQQQSAELNTLLLDLGVPRCASE